MRRLSSSPSAVRRAEQSENSCRFCRRGVSAKRRPHLCRGPRVPLRRRRRGRCRQPAGTIRSGTGISGEAEPPPGADARVPGPPRKQIWATCGHGVPPGVRFRETVGNSRDAGSAPDAAARQAAFRESGAASERQASRHTRFRETRGIGHPGTMHPFAKPEVGVARRPCRDGSRHARWWLAAAGRCPWVRPGRGSQAAAAWRCRDGREGGATNGAKSRPACTLAARGGGRLAAPPHIHHDKMLVHVEAGRVPRGGRLGLPFRHPR